MQYTSALTDSHSILNIDFPNSITPSLSTAMNMAFPTHQQRLILKPRAMKTLRSHDIKRQRLTVPDPQQEDRDANLSNFQFFTTPYTSHPEKPANPELAMNLSPTNSNGKIDLSPCHICHQKPRVKRDLDSYGDCEECGKRTCYVCMRSCPGPYLDDVPEIRSEGSKREAIDISFTTQDIPEAEGRADASDGGQNRTPVEREEHDKMDLRMSWRAGEDMTGCHEHRERICSHCCVERGTDGEVWCLGCLRVEEAHLRFAPT
jgi:hypothetical protein